MASAGCLGRETCMPRRTHAVDTPRTLAGDLSERSLASDPVPSPIGHPPALQREVNGFGDKSNFLTAPDVSTNMQVALAGILTPFLRDLSEQMHQSWHHMANRIVAELDKNFTRLRSDLVDLREDNSTTEGLKSALDKLTEQYEMMTEEFLPSEHPLVHNTAPATLHASRLPQTLPDAPGLRKDVNEADFSSLKEELSCIKKSIDRVRDLAADLPDLKASVELLRIQHTQVTTLPTQDTHLLDTPPSQSSTPHLRQHSKLSNGSFGWKKIDSDVVTPSPTSRIGSGAFDSCSPLVAAVLSGHTEEVRELLKSNADVESNYICKATPGGWKWKEWSGSCLLAAIETKSPTILKLLLEFGADPKAKATNGVTSVWYCCYHGAGTLLRILMDFDDSIRYCFGEVANPRDIGYSPLHISIIQGHAECLKILVDHGVGVELDGENEEGETPLVAAICSGRPRLVEFLVARGATVDKDLRISSQKRISGKNHSLADVPKSCIDIILDSKEPNPVMTHAVAMGLQSQPRQVQAIHPDKILRFFETSSKSMVAMLDALFIRRKIRFRSEELGGRTEFRQAAVIRRNAQQGGKARSNIYRFPHVIVCDLEFDELEQLLNETRSFPDERMRHLIDKILPQEQKQSTWTYRIMEHLCGIQFQHSPVVVHECLAKQVHRDLRIVKTIAHARTFDEVYDNEHCQALISYTWNKVQKYKLCEFVAHLMLLIFAVLFTLQMAINIGLRDTLQVWATVAIPFWFCEIGFEICQIITCVNFGWASEYVLHPPNFVDFCRIVADGAILVPFISLGLDATNEFHFRYFLAIVCFLKWAKLVQILVPFRTFGMTVLPVLFTLGNLGPNILITSFYFTGIAHAIVSINLIDLHLAFNVLNTFHFNVLGESELLEDMHADADDFRHWMLRVFVSLVTFVAPVTLMNIFIAAMTTSYTTAIDRLENLYQKSCCEGTFNLLCVRWCVQTFRKKYASAGTAKTHEKRKPRHMWYCRDRDFTSDDTN